MRAVRHEEKKASGSCFVLRDRPSACSGCQQHTDQGMKVVSWCSHQESGCMLLNMTACLLRFLEPLLLLLLSVSSSLSSPLALLCFGAFASSLQSNPEHFRLTAPISSTDHCPDQGLFL